MLGRYEAVADSFLLPLPMRIGSAHLLMADRGALISLFTSYRMGLNRHQIMRIDASIAATGLPRMGILSTWVDCDYIDFCNQPVAHERIRFDVPPGTRWDKLRFERLAIETPAYPDLIPGLLEAVS